MSSPRRLEERMDGFHRGRVAKTWGGRRMLQGREPGLESVILTSNDYLAISQHPRIVQAMADSLHCAGSVALMSGIFLDDNHPQVRLEADFAAHMAGKAGILCQSGWAANIGLLQTIAEPGIPVYIDQMAHMSLWEGARSAGAQVVPFRHNDTGHLQRQLAKHGSGVITVDSVYSTDGSVCPLTDVVALAHNHNSILVVDESHSLGTHGERGEGLVASRGLASQVQFRTASLAKAIPSRAGLIVCQREEFVDYFKYTALPAVFSSTLLPHDIAGLDAALATVRNEGWRRDRLHATTAFLRGEIAALGYNLEGDAQIIALQAGSEADLMLARDLLEERDVFGSAFFPPATNLRRCVVRLSLHAGLSQDDADRIVKACADIRQAAGIAGWPSTRRRHAAN